MNCYFCQRNLKEIDFKDVKLLRRFTSSSGKIKSRSKNNLCSKHQRKLTRAIKRARFLGLLPYVRK